MIWRVSLFCFYLNRVTVLSKWQAFGATLLPINAIIVSLAFLNLEKVVWNIMRGVDHSTVSPNDDSYLILVMIGILAIWTSIPIAAAYIAQVIINFKKARKPNNESGT